MIFWEVNRKEVTFEISEKRNMLFLLFLRNRKGTNYTPVRFRGLYYIYRSLCTCNNLVWNQRYGGFSVHLVDGDVTTLVP